MNCHLIVADKNSTCKKSIPPFQRVKYGGRRELEDLVAFALSSVSAAVHSVTSSNFAAFTREWDQYRHLPWLLELCAGGADDDCSLSPTTRLKLAAALESLVNVGTVRCESQEKLCEQLRKEVDDFVVFFPAAKVEIAMFWSHSAMLNRPMERVDWN